METIRNRAKDNFPMVLLTLLSIVQALALEFLWDHMRHRSELFDWSFAIIPGWMQVIATFSTIILIWLMYSGMLMRFRWTPTIKDFVPQIALVSTMLFLGMLLMVTSGNTGLKIFTLALIFVVVGIEAHNARRYWNESMGQ